MALSSRRVQDVASSSLRRARASGTTVVARGATRKLGLRHARQLHLSEARPFPQSSGPWGPWLALKDLALTKFPELPPDRPDEYRLSLGKITDTLRLDYQEFFQKQPDWSIYDQSVVLQLRKPWEEPKQLAGCKGTYVTILKGIRAFCHRILPDVPEVDCQVCDGRPYGCDLRVHWTFKGEVKFPVGEPHAVMISAISLYTLKRCSDAEDDSLPWRVHSHII
ncbi:Hypothetical protein (Fragment), partial [Durusdinium trenchii]